MQMLSCELEECLHLSIQHIQTLCGNSFQMLEICSNPTLGMSCCQLNARGKRVTQLSRVSKCSMMCPQSCPKTGIYGCSVRDTHTDKNIVYHKNRDNSPAPNERNNSPQPILLVLTDRSCSRSKQAANPICILVW